jgi:hypothetical protein
MTDLPVIRQRDMAAHLANVAGTHQQIMSGIRERATAEETYQHQRDAELNVSAKMTGRTKA